MDIPETPMQHNPTATNQGTSVGANIYCCYIFAWSVIQFYDSVHFEISFSLSFGLPRILILQEYMVNNIVNIYLF